MVNMVRAVVYIESVAYMPCFVYEEPDLREYTWIVGC